MLRVSLRGGGLPTVVLGSGETLFFGRQPHQLVEEDDPEHQLRTTAVALPRCAPHVSRLLGELVVGEELVRLRWHGQPEAQLSSLFEAPGGARRVTVVAGMAALLYEGENHLVLRSGRRLEDIGTQVSGPPDVLRTRTSRPGLPVDKGKRSPRDSVRG